MSFALLRTLLWTDPLIVFFTAFFGTLNLFLVPFDKGGDRQVRLAKTWAWVLTKVMGIRISVEGWENLEPGQNYIFAGNHRSYTDTPVLFSTLPGNFRFMAKSELFDIPLMGHHLKTAGHIPVSLTNPREAVRSLSQAAQKIHDQKLSIIIFPEGGRTLGELEPFKEGAAIIGIKSGTPIVPFGLIGTTEVQQMHTIAIHPGPVKIILGKPIVTEGMIFKQKTELTQQIRNQVAGLLGVEP